MKTTEMPAYGLTSNCIWNSFQNSNKKHIIITGSRGVGKSKIRLCSDSFVNIGIDALNNALLSDSEWISIDEIGYLESQYSDCLNMITKIMEEKHVLAVVRKQNLSHLQKLCQRKDVFLVDLDAPFGNIGCVIMASGLGKRFGQNKLMAEFHGKPLISFVLDATSDIFKKRIVVTRHESVANLCKERNIDFILHTMPHRNDTIRLGLERLLDTEHCMFCTSDQPLLSKETIAALALSAANAPSKIIRPICGNILGSPVIFPKVNYDELLQLPEGKGGGYVIKQHSEHVQFLPVNNSAELEDIDTPEDLLRLS